MESPSSEHRAMPREDRERRGRSAKRSPFSPKGDDREESEPRPKRRRTGHRHNKGGEDKKQCDVCHRWISKCRPAVIQHQSSKYCLSWRFYGQGHPWRKAEKLAEEAAQDPETARKLVAPVSPSRSPSHAARSSRPESSRVRLRSPDRRRAPAASPARKRSPRSRGESVHRGLPPAPRHRPPSRPRRRERASRSNDDDKKNHRGHRGHRRRTHR